MAILDRFFKSKVQKSIEPGGTNHNTYIEGKEALFETKILRLRRFWKPNENVVIFSRDPGSATALSPVMKLLHQNGVGLSIVTDGRAEEVLRRDFPNTKDLTPKGSILHIAEMLENPNLILTDTSASNRGLETFAAATLADVPIVLVEDYYMTGNTYLTRLKEMQPPRSPARICVMDAAARQIIAEKFPDLAERIVITGQPAFDRFSKEKTQEIKERVRSELRLAPADRLIVYIGTGAGQVDELRAAAPHLAHVAQTLQEKTGGGLYVSFRKHLRDNTPDSTYVEILRNAGVPLANDAAISWNDISASADTVMTSWSTSGLDAAFRRIPVVYLNDESVRTPEVGISYPLPPVTLGASVAVYRMDELPARLAPLLDSETGEVRSLKTAMEKHYKTDGKNAERVASVISELLQSNR